jgi:hypothetical protein
MNPKYLKLELDKPETIALKYPTPQLRWLLMDGRALYTPEQIRDKIEALKIKPGQRFRIERRRAGGGVEWHVNRVRNTGGGSKAAKILDTAGELDQPEASLHPVVETPLERALKSAVVACAQAEAHGKQIGYAVRFTPADVRALGITLLIGMQNGRAA